MSRWSSLALDVFLDVSRKYIRSKGSEHFLGAELKLTTQGGEELKGELYCATWQAMRHTRRVAHTASRKVQEGDSSCILRQLLTDGCANYFWLKWSLGLVRVLRG